LLTKDQNIEAQHVKFQTALMEVNYIGDAYPAESFLEDNAGINLMNTNRSTALIYAHSFMHQELVDVVLNHAVDFFVEGREG
jgi:hypothetical protein